MIRFFPHISIGYDIQHSNHSSWNVYKEGWKKTGMNKQTNKHVHIFGNNNKMPDLLLNSLYFFLMLLRDVIKLMQWAAEIPAIYKHWKMAIKVINVLHLMRMHSSSMPRSVCTLNILDTLDPSEYSILYPTNAPNIRSTNLYRGRWKRDSKKSKNFCAHLTFNLMRLFHSFVKSHEQRIKITLAHTQMLAH